MFFNVVTTSIRFSSNQLEQLKFHTKSHSINIQQDFKLWLRFEFILFWFKTKKILFFFNILFYHTKIHRTYRSNCIRMTIATNWKQKKCVEKNWKFTPATPDHHHHHQQQQSVIIIHLWNHDFEVCLVFYRFFNQNLIELKVWFNSVWIWFFYCVKTKMEHSPFSAHVIL